MQHDAKEQHMCIAFSFIGPWPLSSELDAADRLIFAVAPVQYYISSVEHIAISCTDGRT